LHTEVVSPFVSRVRWCGLMGGVPCARLLGRMGRALGARRHRLAPIVRGPPLSSRAASPRRSGVLGPASPDTEQARAAPPHPGYVFPQIGGVPIQRQSLAQVDEDGPLRRRQRGDYSPLAHTD
jgi:hypothetical protein